MAGPPTPWPATGCSRPASPRPSTAGCNATRPRDSPACSPTSTAATAGASFDRQEQLLQGLRQGPPQQAGPQTSTPAEAPPLNRWTLEAIRTHFAGLADYSLSGIWRLLHRHDLKLRSARVQHYSPDPDYAGKVADLEMCLWEARRYPGAVEAVFLDEFSYRRWPDPAVDWAAATPVADRQQSPEQQWRTIGALNARTGQVNYLDAYIVGRAKVIQFYGRLVEAYPRASTLYVIQD